MKPDATVYSADDNVRLKSTRRGKRRKVGILEVSEGVEVCLLLVILSQLDVEEAMNARAIALVEIDYMMLLESKE